MATGIQKMCVCVCVRVCVSMCVCVCTLTPSCFSSAQLFQLARRPAADFHVHTATTAVSAISSAINVVFVCCKVLEVYTKYKSIQEVYPE